MDKGDARLRSLTCTRKSFRMKEMANQPCLDRDAAGSAYPVQRQQNWTRPAD